MKNVYHSDIMQILLLKGKEGMPVGQLTRMVYNLHSSLFDSNLNYRKLHNVIRWYLWRQSKLRCSPFRRVQYGCYALKSDLAIQLDFCFDTPIEETAVEESKKESAETNVVQLTFDF